tara:strand:- start:296 stop:466 length:171 start_codon:yes stop_codon:yes gene_type:complete
MVFIYCCSDILLLDGALDAFVVGVSEAKSAFIGVPTGWVEQGMKWLWWLDNFGLPL